MLLNAKTLNLTQVIMIKIKVNDSILWHRYKDLIPTQGSLKTLSKENYEKLKNEIETNGFTSPFFVWINDNGFPEILDGHQRQLTLIAMEEEGIDLPILFPCVQIHAETREEAARILLAFTSQYGHMTVEGLKQYAKENGIELSEIFERFNFENMPMEEFKEVEFDDDHDNEKADSVPEIDEKEKSYVERGDIWLLGAHRVMCGDSTSESDVDKLMDGQKADMVFTDPPYGIGFKYNSHVDTKGKDYENFCDDWFEIIKKFSQFIVVSTGWSYNCFWYLKNPTDCFYWLSKNKRTGGKLSHFRKVEPLFIWGKPEKRYNFDFFEQTSEIIKELKGKHTCPKPVSLITSIIDDSGAKDKILDVFLGSGTTLIACQKTKRKCYGVELDEQYCKVIIERYMQFTERDDAYLLDVDGKTKIHIDDVKKMRNLSKEQ